MTGRIHRPRFDIRGNVCATFWPKGCNRYNCNIAPIVTRKPRGWRMRGRAMRNEWRAHQRRAKP